MTRGFTQERNHKKRGKWTAAACCAAVLGVVAYPMFAGDASKTEAQSAPKTELSARPDATTEIKSDLNARVEAEPKIEAPIARLAQAGAKPAPAPAPAAAAAASDFTSAEITPELQRAVRKGLAYLAGTQDRDGSWGANSGQAVAITSLACLAFMGDGNLPGRGEYGPQVEKGLDYVLKNAQETSGLLANDAGGNPMYGHGFATLFLGEVYGMTGDKRCREALLRAVRLIVNTQNREGGWRYQPLPLDADISVTICEIMGLRAARNAGLSVPKETIDAAVQYVRKCQNPADGGFNYMIGSGGSDFARSAAGVASLYYAGVYQDEALKKGLDYLQAKRGGGAHYFYGHYYAVQAMFLAGGNYWTKWFPTIRAELIARQNAASGEWQGDYGNEYGTAMALLILQIPNRYLPIFQR